MSVWQIPFVSRLSRDKNLRKVQMGDFLLKQAPEEELGLHALAILFSENYH